MPALDILDRIVPISDFSRGKAGAAFGMVADNKPVVVMRRNKPSYVVVTPDDYREGEQAKEDLALLLLALDRVRGFDPKKAINPEDSMGEFGITQADLDELPEVEFE